MIWSLSIFLLVLPALAQGGTSSVPSQTSTPIEFTVQTGHVAEIQGLEYASDGKFFVTGGKDSTIKLWTPSGTLIRTIRTGFWVNYLALSHDNQLLLAASRTGTIYLLTLEGRVVHHFPAISPGEGYISCVAISDDNRYFAIGTTRGLILYRVDGTTETRVPLEDDGIEVESVLYTRDGRLGSGYYDGKVRFWTSEGTILRTLAAHEYSSKPWRSVPTAKPWRPLEPSRHGCELRGS